MTLVHLDRAPERRLYRLRGTTEESNQDGVGARRGWFIEGIGLAALALACRNECTPVFAMLRRPLSNGL